MSYEHLDEETLKARIKRDFFSNFISEPLGKIDFSLRAKDSLDHYLLWAEAKAGIKDLEKSFVQLLLTIGVGNYHKKFPTPEYLGAFDARSMAFLPYKYIKDYLYRADFNWTKITPSDHKAIEFAKMLDLTYDVIKSKTISFDYDDKNLKIFIKDSISKGKANPIIIDTDNFDECYLRWCNNVLGSIDLNPNWQKARNHNIALEQDFFLADLISEDDQSCNENLRILLKKDKDARLYFELKADMSQLFEGQFNTIKIYFKDEIAHSSFWELYKRPPAIELWASIINRRDKITPRDIMERKGAFYTPKIWVKKAKEYLRSALGDDFEDEYYIWDLAAGTGNLLNGLTSPSRIFASTLDLSDVLIIKEIAKLDKNDKNRPKEDKLNLLENHIFQFDFLNDNFDKLPISLQEIIKDDKKRKKLIIFINPPYAEASSGNTSSGTGKNKPSVQENKISDLYGNLLSRGNRELFAQFFIRIYKEIPNCILASFSKLKYVSGSAFVNFRKEFKAQFLKGFCVPANTFDNVRGEFPIGFLIWDLNIKKDLKEIQLNVFDKNNKFITNKNFYSNLPQSINKWIETFKQSSNDIKAWLGAGAPDFQNQKYICLLNNKGTRCVPYTPIIKDNLIPISIYFSVRHAIKATWLNDRDQFLYPNDGWITDIEFQNDCLAFALFSSQNRISIKDGINHFIPFSESELNPKEAFKSNFMYKFINGKIKKDKSDSLINDDYNFIPSKPLIFSEEAKEVFDIAKRLFIYYHSFDSSEANASLYDIKAHFQGYNDKGRMNPYKKVDDKYYKTTLELLELSLNTIASKIEPKIYKYGFLKL